MEKSPFALICNEMASKFDEADKAHDIDKTKVLINKVKGIPTSYDELTYAPLFYLVGTSITIVRDVVMKEKIFEKNSYTDPDVIKLHSEAIWYFRHA